MGKALQTNFFESVSKHDLERFHSECLCWLFNNNKQLASEWINVIKKKESKEILDIDINSIEVFTEVDQIDIVLICKEKGNKEKYFGLIIENKIKANEHLIKVKKEKIDDFDNLSIPNEEIILSQTEFYYSRNGAEKQIDIIVNGINKRILQIGKKEAKVNDKKDKARKEKIILLEKSNCEFIFLVPNKITEINDSYRTYQYDNLNDWDSMKFEQLNGAGLKNPWITYTYTDLANFFMYKKELLEKSRPNNEIYANDYIEFLNLEFCTEKKGKAINVDLNNYNLNKYGKLEYMKFFRHAIHLNLNTECQELNKNGKVDSKSSNSGDPLFNIVICDKIELTKEWNCFQLGLQVQGLTNKIYISAGENYNSFKFNPKGSDVEIDELNKYRKLVEKEFDKIINKKTGRFLFEYLGDIKMYPNKNTTKSFYSYSFTFKNEDKNGIDLSDKVYKLSNLINKIYDIYNKTSFTSTSESTSKLSK